MTTKVATLQFENKTQARARAQQILLSLLFYA
jgi:hypothetical protein